MNIVQVCNVGSICGGTAACAWSITRAFPECRHEVLFLSSPSSETRKAFWPVPTRFVRRVDDEILSPCNPDFLILHNTSSAHVGPIRSCLCLQYCHSRGTHAAADWTVACSQWLQQQLPQQAEILYQPVPASSCWDSGSHFVETRHLDDVLTVGRLCTPQLKKWPPETLLFYAQLADRHSRIRWEFVGCPAAMQSPLQVACRGRARFHPAGWGAQRHFRRWHVLLYHHPTLTESFGRTAAEAMLAGCLPIVDGKGGFREQIEHGKTGYLCQTVDEFSTALDSLSLGHRWQMARNARQSAEARFSSAAFATEFRRLLKHYAGG